MKRCSKVIAVLAVAPLIIAGCQPKGSSSSAHSDGAVKTGAGITNGTIHLGMLTALTGPFAPGTIELADAAKFYWSERNKSGGVCTKYPVTLDIQDNKYSVPDTVSLYSNMRNGVLAFQTILGTTAVVALNDSLVADDMLAMLHGQGQEALGYKNISITVPTYDIEAANGLGYLLKQGVIHEGDTIGHIYLQGGYGEGALAGVKAFADQYHMRLVASPIAPTVADLTPAVAPMAAQGIKVLVMSTTPSQLASAALATQQSGLDIPLLGSIPSWVPGLLTGPAGSILKKNLYYAWSSAPFEVKEAADFRDRYVAANPGKQPTVQIVAQFLEVQAMNAILERACATGDLTRAGVLKAKSELDSVTTGVSGTLNLTDPARPATAKSYIVHAADVPGGFKLLEGPYASEFGQKLMDKKK